MTRSRISAQHLQDFEEPTVNLTPLIDVVFVILIMFIVIAPLLELDQIELADHAATPHSTTQSVQESSPIVIHVYQDNKVYFNSRPLSSKELVEVLSEAKKKYPGVTPQVFHDRRAQFGTYQSVKNAAEEAGYTQLDIILKPA